MIETLITLIQVLGENGNLRAWFDTLEQMSDPERSAAVERMAEEMRAGGEDSELIAAVSALASPRLFNGVARTLRDPNWQ